MNGSDTKSTDKAPKPTDRDVISAALASDDWQRRLEAARAQREKALAGRNPAQRPRAPAAGPAWVAATPREPQRMLVPVVVPKRLSPPAMAWAVRAGALVGAAVLGAGVLWLALNLRDDAEPVISQSAPVVTAPPAATAAQPRAADPVQTAAAPAAPTPDGSAFSWGDAAQPVGDNFFPTALPDQVPAQLTDTTSDDLPSDDFENQTMFPDEPSDEAVVAALEADDAASLDTDETAMVERLRQALTDEPIDAGMVDALRADIARERVSTGGVGSARPPRMPDWLIDQRANAPPDASDVAAMLEVLSRELPPQTVVHLPASVPQPDDAFGLMLLPSSMTASRDILGYFHPEDRERAERAAQSVAAHLVDFSTYLPQPPVGTFEVWLTGRARE